MRGQVKNMAPCPICGKVYYNLGRHLTKHERGGRVKLAKTTINIKEDAYEAVVKAKASAELILGRCFPSYSEFILFLCQFWFVSLNLSDLLRDRIGNINIPPETMEAINALRRELNGAA